MDSSFWKSPYSWLLYRFWVCSCPPSRHYYLRFIHEELEAQRGKVLIVYLEAQSQWWSWVLNQGLSISKIQTISPMPCPPRGAENIPGCFSPEDPQPQPLMGVWTFESWLLTRPSEAALRQISSYREIIICGRTLAGVHPREHTCRSFLELL